MIITEISACSRSKDRCNIYADGDFLCALFFDTAAEHSLKVGSIINKEQLEHMLFEDGCKKCYAKACKFLSMRGRSKKELCDKLKEKGFSKEQIEYAIDEADKRGYIDDDAFAREYAEYLLSRGYGGFVLKQKLFQKGIDKETADRVIEELSDGEQLRAAMDFGTKAFAKYAREEDAFKRRNKFYAAMSRHGFGFEAAKAVYERLSGETDD